MRKKKIDLNRMSNKDLLQLKISDLPISIYKSKYILSTIEEVKRELKKKKIDIRLHFYLSDEWFTVNNTQSIGVPFFLAHPRLIELEKKMMGYAEGERKADALKIIRHETGHVIDNSYSIKRDKDRIKIFGKSSIKYPSSYIFRPYSRSFVKNIGGGYSQSHPTEDFAETFAVWLNTRSNWKIKYKNWPAIKKLEYVDSLMKKLCLKRPDNINIYEYYPQREIDVTLDKYYRFKRKRFLVEGNNLWDEILYKIANPYGVRTINASRVLKRNRKILANKISNELEVYKYQASHAVNSMVYRSKRLGFIGGHRKFKLQIFEKQIIDNVRKYFSCGFQKVIF